MRRTKAEAEQTRNDLGRRRTVVRPARRVQHLAGRHRQGRRGHARRVYWHFTDKEDLFQIHVRTHLPAVRPPFTEQLLAELPGGALAALRRHYLAVFEQRCASPRTRQVFNFCGINTNARMTTRQ